MRKYTRTHVKGKGITFRIGEEDKYTMSVRTQVSVNVKTGTISVADGIYYTGRTIYVESYKKQNCNDEALIVRMTESGRKSHANRRKAELDKYFPLKEFNEVIT